MVGGGTGAAGGGSSIPWAKPRAGAIAMKSAIKAVHGAKNTRQGLPSNRQIMLILRTVMLP